LEELEQAGGFRRNLQIRPNYFFGVQSQPVGNVCRDQVANGLPSDQPDPLDDGLYQWP